jgi:hypothetical protein
VFDYEGVTVAHPRSAGVPSQTGSKPWAKCKWRCSGGRGGGLNVAKAAEMVSLLEPSIVIPMHYQIGGSLAKLAPLSKFLKRWASEKLPQKHP